MPGFSTGISAGAAAAFDAIDSQHPTSEKDKVSGAATDFEALLIGQILKSAHGESGWLGSGDDDAGDAAIGLGEEQLARNMASSGGFGLAKMIERGLADKQTQATTGSSE
jgi:Rod binding domain-containing protein